VTRRRGTSALVALGLVVLVLAVFGQTVTHDFVNFDDPDYVTENPQVQSGLNPTSIRWAMTSFAASNWHPLTWMSHMLDVDMAGLDPGLHHATNVVLHGLAAVLLFLALQRLSGELWPSALVAALFAIHPLRVESVAWIAERKDVLSGVFWMLTMLLWARYVRKPSVGRYLAVAASLALGLASKPMVVTLPVVLILLDVWPLRRLARVAGADRSWAAEARGLLRLSLEKIPLLALAAASSLVTMAAQGRAVGSLESFSLATRLANAVVSWASYVRMTVFPTCLSVFYPYPKDGWPAWLVLVCAVFLGLVTTAVVWQRRRRPWLAAGWFWYLGTSVPVIGLVQVGTQSMADRYTYIPQIGLWIMAVWSAVEVIERHPAWRTRVIGTAAGLCVVFAVVAARQTTTWKNGFTLFSHALTCDDDNWLAHVNLAELLVERGQYQAAIDHCLRSLEINPANPVPHVTIGNALLELDRTQEALDQYRAALEIEPNSAVTWFNLGLASVKSNDGEEAAVAFGKALALRPEMNIARTQLGVQLMVLGRAGEAVDALCVEGPGIDPSLSFRCGLALVQDHRLEEAVGRLRTYVAAFPGDGAGWAGLGHTLADLGRTEEALSALRRAQKLRPDDPQIGRRIDDLTAPADEE
jgi:cytochrome c-type biogenesis protein CcmH/NrfG